MVEDNPTKTFHPPTCYHYSWKEIDEILGDDAWIISHRDSAIRSFGFLIAHELGAEWIFTLDDDCYPSSEESFCDEHIKNMQQPRWAELIPGMRTRGLPYFNRGITQDVVANIGLWTGVPDLDAIETLAKGLVSNYTPPHYSCRVIPAGQYVPHCGMNLSFHHQVAPLLYLPLMGDNSPYNRFDDIWFGVVFKKICDHLRLRITCGKPFVKHLRASDTMSNLVKESRGICQNERFWHLIDYIPLQGSTPFECMSEFGNAIAGSVETYIAQLGKAIQTWLGYFHPDHPTPLRTSIDD